MNILVSGASGIIGYGILNSLEGHKANRIGTSVYTNSIANKFCETFIEAPYSNSSEYLEWLAEVITSHKIDLVFPGIDVDMYLWSDQRSFLESLPTTVMLNRQFLIDLCKDKWEFHNFLEKNHSPFRIPSSLETDYDKLVEAFGDILVMKPREGFGSKGIVRIYDKETFDNYRHEIGFRLMVQKYVGNDEEEFTVSAFGDGKGGHSCSISLRRKLSKDGYTEIAEVVVLKEIDSAVRELCHLFKPLGPTNFQFRLVDGMLFLLEINPRISSSTSIRTAFGYNESLMSVDFFLHGVLPEQPKIKFGNAIRYISDKITYY